MSFPPRAGQPQRVGQPQQCSAYDDDNENDSDDSGGSVERQNAADLAAQMAMFSEKVPPIGMPPANTQGSYNLYNEAPPPRQHTGTTSQSIAAARADGRARAAASVRQRITRGGGESSQAAGGARGTPKRASWDTKQVQFMMARLAECKDDGLFYSTKAKDWLPAYKRVAAALVAAFPDIPYTATAVKSKHESERTRYVMWLDFKNTPGVEYIRETGRIIAGHEQWEKYLENYMDSRISLDSRQAPLGDVSIYEKVFAKETRAAAGTASHDELEASITSATHIPIHEGEDRRHPSRVESSRRRLAARAAEAAADAEHFDLDSEAAYMDTDTTDTAPATAARRSVRDEEVRAFRALGGDINDLRPYKRRAISDVVTASINIRSALTAPAQSIHAAVADFHAHFAKYARDAKGEMGVVRCAEMLSTYPNDVRWNATPTASTKRAQVAVWVKDVEFVDFGESADNLEEN